MAAVAGLVVVEATMKSGVKGILLIFLGRSEIDPFFLCCIFDVLAEGC